MDVLNFLAAHWADILLIVAAIVAVVFLIKQGETKKLKTFLFELVTEAERQYGGGTGELKFAAVADWIYQRIPTWLKPFFTSAGIAKLIEQVLEEAKEKWADNEDLGDYTAPEDVKDVLDHLAEDLQQAGFTPGSADKESHVPPSDLSEVPSEPETPPETTDPSTPVDPEVPPTDVETPPETSTEPEVPPTETTE